MVHDLQVFEFTGKMADILPSSQKEFKVIPPEVGGYDLKTLDKLCRAGQPFLIEGVIGGQYKGKSLFITYLEYKDEVYNISLAGWYFSVSNTVATSYILLQYDPVLKILKGRRP